MGNREIHPTAVVEPGAELGNDIIIEPYAIVKKNVVLHDGVTVKSHAYIDGYTTIGENTVVYPGACIGTKTQNRKFKGEKTYVKIGKNCEIREFVTINSSWIENPLVQVGDDCLIMAYCHIAHSCRVGNGVIMSNNATLAGHVTVEDYATIGGMTPIHQWVRIGAYSMVGGLSRITHDVPPYMIGGGIPFKYGGLNIVGLKRHGFPLEVRQELAKAFRIVFRSGYKLGEAISLCEDKIKDLPQVRHFLDFAKETKRGLMGLQGIVQNIEAAVKS